jgi:hypothetical protein
VNIVGRRAPEIVLMIRDVDKKKLALLCDTTLIELRGRTSPFCYTVLNIAKIKKESALKLILIIAFPSSAIHRVFCATLRNSETCVEIENITINLYTADLILVSAYGYTLSVPWLHNVSAVTN